MLEDTLVVCIGEFGRSPQKGVSTSGNSNTADGRDHWPYCYTAVMAGAGFALQTWARSPAAATPLLGAGARWCDDPATL